MCEAYPNPPEGRAYQHTAQKVETSLLVFKVSTRRECEQEAFPNGEGWDGAVE